MSFGINSISFRGSILWNGTPDVIKSSNTVFAFMKNIKNWSGELVTVVFVYNFVTFCSCNIFSISWCLLVLLISINYQHPTVNKIFYYYYYYSHNY